MHPLTKLQTAIYYIGGTLLVIGALLPIFSNSNSATPFVFGIGALLFATMQFVQRYDGDSIVVRRLRRQQVLGAIALLITAALMFCSRYGIHPFTGSEWTLTLAIGAILETYTAFRLPVAINKEQGNQ